MAEARDVLVVGVEVYLPRAVVRQDKLEVFDGASAGKYTIGLGQVSGPYQ